VPDVRLSKLFVMTGVFTACAPAAQQLPVPAAAGAVLARLSGGGDPIVSRVETSDPGHRLLPSEWAGNGWGDPRNVVTGAGWVVHWADFPSVVRLAVHWLQGKGTTPYA